MRVSDFLRSGVSDRDEIFILEKKSKKEPPICGEKDEEKYLETLLAEWRELTPQSLILRLALAMFVGGIIGLERG